MTISINEIASGMGIKMNNEIFVIMSYTHVKPGKGVAFARIKLKNIKSQQTIERTFKPSEALDDLPLEERRLQNQYKSGDTYHFMDLTTYEQMDIPVDTLGDDAKFLQDNLQVTGICYDGQVLKVNLPTFIETEIIASEPGIRGDSSRSGNKPATIDTGAIIQVPLFIDTGDRIRVDTRTGEYVERLKK